MRTPDSFAKPLIQAYRSHTRIDVDPESGPQDTATAYAVQHAVWQAMAGDVRPTAWKVGAPTPDVEPTAAPVFPDRLALSPAVFPAEMFSGLAIEAEIALRFGRALPARAEPYSRTEILKAIGSAHVAMELVDTRLASAEAAGPLWRLADNLLNGALVLGDAIPRWRDLDWQGLSLVLSADGETLPGVPTRPPLGDIFHCLPWWITHVGGVRAGDVVTTGAWNGMHPVGQAAKLEVAFTGLGVAVARIDTLPV